MQIGMVGLGRMGGNMARRLLRGGHEVVAYAADANAVRQLAGEGAVGALTFDDFVAKLKAPDRKSTRLNSSHGYISYADFCLTHKWPFVPTSTDLRALWRRHWTKQG